MIKLKRRDDSDFTESGTGASPHKLRRDPWNGSFPSQAESSYVLLESMTEQLVGLL